MDKCSYFIKHKALFGSYPTDESVEELEKIGVCYFIDLTCENERNIVKYNYSTSTTYINFPIPDRKIPNNSYEFCSLILKISKIIKNSTQDKKIYIHCKGGHGRSGVVVACILCNLFKILPEKALTMTTAYHSQRKTMRLKWRELGSPQTRLQKAFVMRMCKPIYFYRAYKQGQTAGFSMFSQHSVTLENVGTFPSAEAAFQSLKDPANREYTVKQENALHPKESKVLGRNCQLRSDWNFMRDKLMQQVIENKVKQNDDIKQNLFNTFLRPIIQHTKYDNYWGDGGDGSGLNKLGTILSNVRNILIQSNF